MTIAPRVTRAPLDSPHPPAAGTLDAGGSRGCVLLVATSAGNGGIERLAALLAGKVVERGFRVHALTGSGSFFADECARLGVTTRPLANRNAADVRAAVHIADAIRETEAAIVHVHSRRDFVAAQLGATLARLRERRPIRLILHAHLDKPIGSLHWLTGRLSSATVDCIVAVSESVRGRIIRTHGLRPSQVRLLYNGIEIERFAPRLSADAARYRAQARARYGLSPTDRVIGMVGRLADKGQDRVVAMLPAIRREAPNARLLLIGPGDPESLRESARAAGVKSAVVFAGAVPDIATVLPAVDVLAHLPETESFGLALVEAMASGLPIVATSVGGCREVVVDGQTGYLVDGDDPRAAEAALIRLLSDDAADLRARLGDAGQAAATRFSLQRQVDGLVDCYRELAAL